MPNSNVRPCRAGRDLAMLTGYHHSEGLFAVTKDARKCTAGRAHRAARQGQQWQQKAHFLPAKAPHSTLPSAVHAARHDQPRCGTG